MTQDQRPRDDDKMPPHVRKEEEAADRARGRGEGAGASPKLDEIVVPEPHEAPLAGESGDDPATSR